MIMASSESSYRAHDMDEESENVNKRRNKWVKEVENLFLHLWRERLDKLRACRKNSHILMEIAVEMELEGYKFSILELKTKMHNMTAKYRKEKKQFRATGIPSDWEPYEEMESLITEFERGRSEALDRESHQSSHSEKKFKHNRDESTPYHENNSENVSEEEENFDEHASQDDKDVALSKIPFISVRGDLKPNTNRVAHKNITNECKLKRSLTENYDEIDLFFISMSKTVRKLPIHAQVHLKKDISNLVFEAELKSLPHNNVNSQ
ncbi:uncharacterized protein LOC101455486 [Ceratitis capitata]|uniref:BESS domain-containing protein n=1 Tax=Ceratitis capitata TaxID=7213 RepID=W8AGV5_CERCA|nr:uncharacterized protein LOC101455486 [Ceratitis capitata]